MRWAWLPLLIGLIGCSAPPSPPDPSPKADASDARWVITGTEPENLLLTNGTMGLWIQTDRGLARHDAFRMVDGALVPIPDFAAFSPGAMTTAEELQWSFDLRTGEFVSVRTSGNRRDEMRIALHPTRPVGAVEWTTTEPTFGFVWHGALARLPQLERTQKADADYRTYQAQTAIQGETKGPVRLTLVSSFGPKVFGVFADYEDMTLPSSYQDVFAASKKAHAEMWRTDVEIDGPAEDQLAVRAMLYYLRRGATAKLPPFGTSNAKYRGARYWDAEAWMLPVLALVDRDKAKAATKWRANNLGDRVPWEAARGGMDVTPKEFGNALHVAGWAVWWMHRAWHLGIADFDDYDNVLEVAYRQFKKAAVETERGVEIRGVESPDEGRLRDNDLVTNQLALRVAVRAISESIIDRNDMIWWERIVKPTAADGLPATYDNDLLKGYQQTAALLAIYPLEEDFGESVAEKMFDRYANLTSEVGPAMSESIHATIGARLKRPDAYERWRTSWQTYTDNAMMFHERRNKQDAYFMTGAAGCLQTVFYGFSGIHLEREGTGAAAAKSLDSDYALAFRPSLPSEWKSLTLRNIFLGPTRATVRITHSGVTIEEGG
ncbi:MAG: hypothetical protein M3R13_01975 [Armatimonadota bacterium]|nr:hypothetical protein [Armatimonadota bacterium]